MNFLSLIEAKRDGRELTSSEIQEFVSQYTAGVIPDYQAAAFLMAIFFRGLSPVETSTLTLAMRDSGDVLKFPADSRPLVDKHSTGGVGDKVSLPLAPLLACLGFRVPMISGRGLGITGGTLDKLDSIPGFKTALESSRIIEIVQQVGCVICGQTSKMVPADKGLYALRDVTGTVPNQSLIVASILSKKLAESLDALILDVKYGAAAFMSTMEQARQLADAMVTLGNQCGVKTGAILSDMNTPLGEAAGNWLEVKESVACLENRGPVALRDLVVECAARLLLLTGKKNNADEARAHALHMLQSGAPRKKWNEMIAAQGADLDAFERKLQRHSTATVVLDVTSDRSGIVQACDARTVGEVVRDLGGGRVTKASVVNYDVGIDSIVPIGTHVQTGQPLARIHAATTSQATRAVPLVQESFRIDTSPLPRPLQARAKPGA